jgi:hypothetical protein
MLYNYCYIGGRDPNPNKLHLKNIKFYREGYLKAGIILSDAASTTYELFNEYDFRNLYYNTINFS